jgi:hypothetical protein
MFARNRISFALLFVSIILGVYLFRVALWGPMPLTGIAIDDGYERASGVVHVHTTLSDGGGTPEDVIAAARRSNLDFVAITDHNNLDALPYAGYHGETLALVGSELSTTVGHVLALGLEKDPEFRFSGSATDGLVDIHDLGGIAFVAHPLSPRNDLQWSATNLPGPWGIEIINGDNQWRRAGLRSIATLALFQLNQPYTLLRIMTSPKQTLNYWDEMLEKRDVIGIFGADAHSRLRITDGWSLKFPSYDSLFSVAQNHLLLNNPLSGEEDIDRALMLDALREGRFYIGLDGLAPANMFSFIIESKDARRWTMGQSVPYEPDLRVRAGGRVPADAQIRLLRDGEVFAETLETLNIPLPGVGVYRVEVAVDGWPVPWIISNPIAVFKREKLLFRKSDWPSRSKTVEAAEILDGFNGDTVFVASRDTKSTINENLLAPDGDRHNGGAIRMAFRLGQPTLDHPDVFVALVNLEDRDLEGRKGMTFWIRADGVYRMWVQVRDENFASTDESTEWWFKSVKTKTDWEQVSVPFTSLRSINPQTDGQLDLDKIRAIVFVIDKGAMKPGSQGTIWLDELGVY